MSRPDAVVRPPIVDRLALGVALRVSGAVALCGAVAGVLLGGGPWGTLGAALALALVAAAAAYRAVNVRIARRVELARQTLREARKRRFDALSRLPHARDRDELDALVRQVYRVGRALQEEIERLEKTENYRRDFLGDVSHELRTPIFAVSGFAETLLDGALEDERVRRRFVEKILTNARRLETLSRDLAAISKLETGEVQVARAPFALGPLVVETIEGLERYAAEREVTLEARLAADLPAVLGDRERIRQVLVNLIENAIKYNEPGGHVEVTARRLGQDVRVAVVDDGIGIPPEALPRLTERFYRVDKSRSREQGGTGLGLAIVKHLLEAHGQRLSVESRPGYGSTFAFLLPQAEPAAAPGREPASAARP
ncbi:MAG: sensor histidine kinase [Rubricoccaceae bacterium]